MLYDFETSLTADLARTLESDPALTLEDAVTRIVHLAGEAGVSGLDQRLERLAASLRRRGVINPRFLGQDDIRPHFFLANGRSGQFGQVIRDVEHSRENISQYVVYGHWDSVVVLYGSAEQAARLMERLEEGAYESPVMFAAKDVLLTYRHLVPQTFQRPSGMSDDQINEVALNFDSKSNRVLRDILLDTKVMIGPTLTLGHASPYPINAFIGISVKARTPISSAEILNVLMAQDDLRTCMIDFFQVDHGIPYHYFAKIACATMNELDAATNAVALAPHAGVRFEGETLVVAHGSEQLPLVRKPDISSMSVVPDVTGILRTAEQVFDYLGPQERTSFNELAGERQLATLRALTGLRIATGIFSFDDETRQRLESAIATFGREATRSQGNPNLTGAVVEITTMTEKNARRLLDRAASSVFGDDPAMIQRELKLPTRKVWNLALGKVVQAFRVARADTRFADIQQHIPEEWVQRLDKFADERNAWAHGAADGTHTQVIDRAFGAMHEGIQIIAWLARETRLLEEKKESQARQGDVPDLKGDTPAIRLSPRPEGSDLTIYVGHSPSDKTIAGRLTKGLTGMGYKSDSAGWELRDDSSITRAIQNTLQIGDVLIVALNPRSVQSKWVTQELDITLIDALKDQNVLVIPVLSEDCEVPPLIRQQYEIVDFREDFETGFLSLFSPLRRHRDAMARHQRLDMNKSAQSESAALALLRLRVTECACGEH